MKVLVCGSRTWHREDIIAERLAQLPRGATILHGDAHGADRIAAQCARNIGLDVVDFPVNWKPKGYYDPQAGRKRNLLMLDQDPDLVIAFHILDSHGTAHTVSEARKRGIPVEVHPL